MNRLSQSLVSNTTPLSLLEWLTMELDKRDIDFVYARYILSLFQQDYLDLEFTECRHVKKYRLNELKEYGEPKHVSFSSKHKPQKFKNWNKQTLFLQTCSHCKHKCSDIEKVKKRAVVECLLSIYDDVADVEELVDKIAFKLKSYSNKKDDEDKNSKNVKNDEIENSFYKPPSSPLLEIQRYFDAFPRLDSADEEDSAFFERYNNVWIQNMYFWNNSSGNELSPTLNPLYLMPKKPYQIVIPYSSLKSINVCKTENILIVIDNVTHIQCTRIDLYNFVSNLNSYQNVKILNLLTVKFIFMKLVETEVKTNLKFSSIHIAEVKEICLSDYSMFCKRFQKCLVSVTFETTTDNVFSPSNLCSFKAIDFMFLKMDTHIYFFFFQRNQNDDSEGFKRITVSNVFKTYLNIVDVERNLFWFLILPSSTVNIVTNLNKSNELITLQDLKVSEENKNVREVTDSKLKVNDMNIPQNFFFENSFTVPSIQKIYKDPFWHEILYLLFDITEDDLCKDFAETLIHEVNYSPLKMCPNLLQYLFNLCLVKKRVKCIGLSQEEKPSFNLVSKENWEEISFCDVFNFDIFHLKSLWESSTKLKNEEHDLCDKKWLFFWVEDQYATEQIWLNDGVLFKEKQCDLWGSSENKDSPVIVNLEPDPVENYDYFTYSDGVTETVPQNENIEYVLPSSCNEIGYQEIWSNQNVEANVCNIASETINYDYYNDINNVNQSFDPNFSMMGNFEAYGSFNANECYNSNYLNHESYQENLNQMECIDQQDYFIPCYTADTISSNHNYEEINESCWIPESFNNSMFVSNPESELKDRGESYSEEIACKSEFVLENEETISASSNTFLLPQIKKRCDVRCHFFMKGNCFKGEFCKYSHDKPTLYCYYFQQGYCYKGSSCPYLHEFLRDDRSSTSYSLESEEDFPSLPADASMAVENEKFDPVTEKKE